MKFIIIDDFAININDIISIKVDPPVIHIKTHENRYSIIFQDKKSSYPNYTQLLLIHFINILNEFKDNNETYLIINKNILYF